MMEDCRIVGQLHEFVPARVSDRKLRTAIYLASAITLRSTKVSQASVVARASISGAQDDRVVAQSTTFLALESAPLLPFARSPLRKQTTGSAAHLGDSK